MNVHEIPNPNPNPNPSPIQTNMNVNEVISNRAIQLLGGEVRSLVITLTKCVT